MVMKLLVAHLNFEPAHEERAKSHFFVNFEILHCQILE